MARMFRSILSVVAGVVLSVAGAPGGAQAQAPGLPPAAGTMPPLPPDGSPQIQPPAAPPSQPPAAPPSQPPAPPPGQPGGYPPAPGYPQGYPPQQGYPPAPGYPQGYPTPGYPGYPPAQVYSPVPSYTAFPPPPPPPPLWRRGFLAMPYMGINSFQGTTGEGFGPGFRVGGIFGGRWRSTLSLNSEVLFDLVNMKDTPAAADVSAASVELTFSPLVHIPSENIEFVIGPKLGAYAWALHDGTSYVDDAALTYTGVVVGFNAGLFAELGPGVAIGGLFSLSVRKPERRCVKVEGYVSVCGHVDDVEADKVVGFNGALLF